MKLGETSPAMDNNWTWFVFTELFDTALVFEDGVWVWTVMITPVGKLKLFDDPRLINSILQANHIIFTIGRKVPIYSEEIL